MTIFLQKKMYTSITQLHRFYGQFVLVIFKTKEVLFRKEDICIVIPVSVDVVYQCKHPLLHGIYPIVTSPWPLIVARVLTHLAFYICKCLIFLLVDKHIKWSKSAGWGLNARSQDEWPAALTTELYSPMSLKDKILVYFLLWLTERRERITIYLVLQEIIMVNRRVSTLNKGSRKEKGFFFPWQFH